MIKACIFDLGGTIVDRYSLTPLLSLKKLFQKREIHLNNDLIFKDMGKNKKDHINLILNDDVILKQWIKKYDKHPSDKDVDSLFDHFNRIQMKYSDEMIDILPETKPCIGYLDFNYIRTGCTTGFNKKNMDIIRGKLERNNIYLDRYISSTCLDKPSRPHPFMIQEIMNRLNITDPKSVIKVDDTVVGIHEGMRAKCWTVGVARWSINMNISSIEDAYGLHIYELQNQLKKSREILYNGGADFVIDTLDELPQVIENINNICK
tara:strand:- start:2724 stop:3512 length:789 start_codon:yes stop_codon:yes gene_type:complete